MSYHPPSSGGASEVNSRSRLQDMAVDTAKGLEPEVILISESITTDLKIEKEYIIVAGL